MPDIPSGVPRTASFISSRAASSFFFRFIYKSAYFCPGGGVSEGFEDFFVGASAPLPYLTHYGGGFGEGFGGFFIDFGFIGGILRQGKLSIWRHMTVRR